MAKTKIRQKQGEQDAGKLTKNPFIRRKIHIHNRMVLCFDTKNIASFCKNNGKKFTIQFIFAFVGGLMGFAYGQNGDTLQTSQLKSPVTYSADEVMDVDFSTKTVTLLKNAKLQYETTSLSACKIIFNLKNHRVKATYCLDSAGKKIGIPELIDQTLKTKADSLEFNFKSKRGITYGVKLKEGEGYILGDKIKRQKKGDIHIKTARYTTCDLDHPHYYFKLRNAIVKPSDKIISGPMNLYIADIPTPLGVPFGFFPNRENGSNGIIIPAYGYSPALGFYLTGGGYYYKFANLKNMFKSLNDKLAITLKGDIFANGSWGAKADIEYNVRYKYSGKINLDKQNIINGDPLFGANITKSFFIRWTHRQSPKFRPNSNFNININYGNSQNFQNPLNVLQSDGIQRYLSNTFNSNISWSKQFKGGKNLNVYLRHSQNTNSKTIFFTLPDLNYTVNRFFPLKRRATKRIGKPKWYEKIGVNYNANFKNQAKLNDSVFRENPEKLFDNMAKGATQNISISTSIKFWKKRLSINPNYNLKANHYFTQTRRNFRENKLQTDTLNVFSTAAAQNISANLSTKFFLFYQFAKPLRRHKDNEFRHTILPNISFRYSPDNQNVLYWYTANAEDLRRRANKYDNNIISSPNINESMRMNFSLSNTLEYKFHDTSARKQFKKIFILDNFNLNSGYDFLKDSINLDPISIQANTNIFKKTFRVNFSTTLDPYFYKNGQRTRHYLWDKTGRIGVFSNADLSLSYNLTPTSRKQNEKDGYLQPILQNFVEYKINYRKSRSENRPNTIAQSILFRGDLTLTENWNVKYQTGYDFTNKKMSFTSLEIRRDLHCWEIAFNWIPFGFVRSYNIRINVKAPSLRDLKLHRRRNWYDNGIR